MKDKNNEQNNNKPIKCNKRLFIFVIFLVICFFIALSKLIEYQIVDYDKYNMISKTNNSVKEIVPAARGDIVDRNGVVLATDTLNLSLVIGENFPYKTISDNKETIAKKNDQGNDIILKLIKILNNKKIDWEENSPITKTKPYSFIEEKSFEIKKLKNALSQQQYATAQDSIELLTKKFNINKQKYSEQQIRDIAVFRANMLIKGFSEYNKTFVVIDKVEPEFLDKITGIGNKLKGVQILETSKRTYPSGDVLPHIIGNVGPLFKEDYEKYKKKGYPPNAFVGKFGIEEKFEEQLHATNGVMVLEKDEDGNTINRFYEKEPKAGNTVRLTIDFELQKKILETLPAFVKSHPSRYAASKGATVCVMDIKTGEILALVCYPSYDINLYNSKYDELTKAPLKPLVDRAKYEIFRPGSSFKPFIALTALSRGVITPSTTFPCRDGVAPNMRCAHYGHPATTTNIYTAIARSCNNYFYQVGKKLGIDAIDEYAPYFGFGVDTGLEINNSLGRITNPSPEFQRKYNTRYSIGELYQTCIGQSDCYVTNLQQAICQSTIANKGKRLASHIVKSIEGPRKNILMKTKPKVMSQINIPDYAYNTVLKGMQMMWKTKSFAEKSLDIASKSGSPQHSARNSNLTNAAGVGFYPSQSPEIAMSILVEDGMSAENYFKDIVKFYEELKKNKKK